jgi:hypothetical protein
MSNDNLNERPGLLLAQTAVDSGMNFREFKKWLKEELNAVDAEADAEYALSTDNGWDVAWPPYDH